jgi:hypothetical protein
MPSGREPGEHTGRLTELAGYRTSQTPTCFIRSMWYSLSLRSG